MLRSFSLLAFASAALSAHAGLLGSVVNFTNGGPNAGTTTFDSGNAVVTNAAVEFGNINGLPDFPGTADLTDTTLTITQNFGSRFLPAPFNGFSLAVVSGAAITGATYVSGFQPRSISIVNGRLFLDYAGVFFSSGSTSVINITTASVASSVPGPLAALPFALMAFKRRKRA